MDETRCSTGADSNQDRKNRERHSNKTNRYPVHVALYSYIPPKDNREQLPTMP